MYLWHCSREGGYSLYSPEVANENFLRGVQETDANGKVTFKSIFPGAYSGRWPHIHFQVYPDVNEAIAAGTETATSQIALPEDACKLVYAASGYEQSISNLAQTSLATDMVFSDGWDAELGTATRQRRRRLQGDAERAGLTLPAERRGNACAAAAATSSATTTHGLPPVPRKKPSATATGTARSATSSAATRSTRSTANRIQPRKKASSIGRAPTRNEPGAGTKTRPAAATSSSVASAIRTGQITTWSRTLPCWSRYVYPTVPSVRTSTINAPMSSRLMSDPGETAVCSSEP